MTSRNLNGSSPSEPGTKPRVEAVQLFEALAAELEEGRGDPESIFAAHPDLEVELRTLYRGWLQVDGLFRELAQDQSVVRAACGALRSGAGDERALLARLAAGGFAEHYELGEELGHGGMGVVRRVTDRVLGRELAMKVIRPVEPGRRARLLRRFLEEAEVIGGLEHPGIVPIHELGLDSKGQVYFTMPLIRGRTLQEILRLSRKGQEGWTRERVLEVLLKACDAVAYAHSRGVLHRDLKPANVIVGRFGMVYVMDWGLARSVGVPDPAGGEASMEKGALTLEGEVLGTPAYMAPEQALGRSERLDERCDVYALGAILYEALAGVRPYGECSSAEALERLGQSGPPPVEKLTTGANQELCAVVRRAMARDREQRYPSVAALAGDLRAYLEGRVVRAHRTGAWVEASKWVQRNRRLAISLAVAILAIAAGLIVSLVLLQRAERERDNVFRLSQSRTLSSLVERADRLWPPHPARIAELRRWQDGARALLASLEPNQARGDAGLRAQLASLAAREAGWTEEDRWWHGEIAKLVASIEELTDPARGLMGEGLGPHGFGIGRRLAVAERLRRDSERPEVKARWREARASVREDPRFAGLELEPQVGLTPLGKDPRSGLWEFAHVLSGEIPVRDEAGELVLTDESALVLVLLSAGEFLMGSQIEDPAGPNFTRDLNWHEYPAHLRRVGAFFLAKHEMTQAQWLRTTGSNPSFFREDLLSPLFPVETVTWFAATDELARSGLRLPTEAEWEYAGRAGTTTSFFWGEDALQVNEFANVKDLDAVRIDPSYQHSTPAPSSVPEGHVPKEYDLDQDHDPVHDGFRTVAPVGSFRPNAWGFHDILGNVWEWCEDEFTLYPGARGSPYEEPIPAGIELRIMRGGAHHRTVARCAGRGSEVPDFAYRAVGLRAARSLDP